MNVLGWKTIDTGGHVEVFRKDLVSVNRTPVMVQVSSDCVIVVKRISKIDEATGRLEFSGFLTSQEYEELAELYETYGYETSEILLEKDLDGRVTEKELFAQMFGKKEQEEIRQVFSLA
ncbi:hypothetical protein [Geobacillus subterraneus]|uniref:Uncharacterized protein n=1 Tax=Geobacillus subterraneus TaxID=129338 RepID=A0A679FWB4_9BACL|nr:hypothetical protein [Geobacillus subterraneus]BBW98985.1 hypothetical protein GsuE55_38180 [Geobacillus subterraneus]